MIFKGKLLNPIKNFPKYFSTTNKNLTKVCVVGASGGIGQPLSLLLKHSPLIKSLALYDVKNMNGIAMDLGHIDTSANVLGFTGDSQLSACLDGAEIVVITAGIPRKPGMDRSDLFAVNAKVIVDVIDKLVKVTNNPMICIVTNPVNSLVPVAAEVLRLNGAFDTRKLFGLTTLDVVRANTFYAKLAGVDPRNVNVPVVAGHSGTTIVPLFSLAEPKIQGAQDCSALIPMVRDAGTHVVQAKAGDGSATLGMAYSAFRFVNSLLQARLGKENVVECSYVYSKFYEDVDFFTDPIKINCEGFNGVYEYSTITEVEQSMIANAKITLKEEIKLGYDFVKNNYKAPSNVEQKVFGRATSEPISKAWQVSEAVNSPNKNTEKTVGKLGEAETAVKAKK